MIPEETSRKNYFIILMVPQLNFAWFTVTTPKDIELKPLVMMFTVPGLVSKKRLKPMMLTGIFWN